jgi:DNA-binding winged helix-turn-helix (wHTH) protein
MRIGAFLLDPLSHRIEADGRTVQLSPLASRFLQSLARAHGDVVSREALIDELWRGNHRVGDPALSRVVSEIRRAVGDDPKVPRLVQTVHGSGYRLVVAPPPSTGPRASPERSTPARQNWVTAWMAALVTVIVVAGLVIVMMIYAVKLRPLL